MKSPLRFVHSAIVAVVAGASLASIAVSGASPTAPQIDRSTVWIDAVKRGPLVRQVRGLGRLVSAGSTGLKAEIKIPESQAREVIVSQEASIDTRNGIFSGKVSRIDPSVRNGVVTVEVAPDATLPKDARPDLAVDGTITLERLEDVLYISRPVHGPAASTLGLYKIDDDGKGAALVQVKLGRASIDKIEILGGLKEGDRVILSDTAAFEKFDRIIFK